MDFCYKCRSWLVSNEVKSSDQILMVLSVNKCGNKVEDKAEKIQLNNKTILHDPKQLAIIGKYNQFNILTTIHFTFLSGGKQNAFAWQIQTKGNDDHQHNF